MSDTGTKEVKNIIVESAAIFFSKYGFYKTTMDEIAQHIHKAKGALYYYFKSKEELFNMPIVELREYMNSLSNAEIQEVAKIFEEDDIERDPLELLTASKLFDYMKHANGSVNIEF